MCGICGKISLDGKKVEPRLLKDMMDLLAHRGPDGEGAYLRQGPRASVGLGHRRLSIIDLSEAGRQPMANEDETLWVVLNGEIYNFQTLRTSLETKGHRFRSRTDTEVILHLYEEEGVGGMEQLRGMFAFALWDEKLEMLILCRDRIGIKPLVYYFDDRRLIFASEIKALLAHQDISRELDWNALDLYLTFNYIPAPYTIFKKIRKLRPGHLLIYRHGKAMEEEYWNLPRSEERNHIPTKDFHQYKRDLFNTLDEAVRSHMIADVPIGAFLSGGIDSSIIVGLMSRHSNRPVETYSIGFEDLPLFDETKYARDVARLNGTDHHEIMLTSKNILTTIPRVLDSFDEPFGDSSAVPTFVVSQQTSQNVKVALSGDGGDELFAGYRMYSGEYWHSIYRLIPSVLRRKVIAPALNALPDSRDQLFMDYLRRIKKFVRGSKDDFAERFFLWNEIGPKHLRERILRHPHMTSFDQGKDILEKRLHEYDGDRINRMLYADFKESLPGDMLFKVDAMSMLSALEVRVPLLDHQVCEMAFSVPGAFKIKRGRGKHLLLETFKDLLPPSLHRRPKWGFEIPIGRWLRKDLKYLIDDFLSPQVITRQAVFQYDAVASILHDFHANRQDTSWQIWSLIVFQSWYSRHIENLRR